MSDQDNTPIMNGVPPDTRKPLDKTIESVELVNALTVDSAPYFLVRWQCVNFGFGELVFFVDSEGVLRCNSERMGRPFVLSVLAKLVETARMEWETDDDHSPPEAA